MFAVVELLVMELLLLLLLLLELRGMMLAMMAMMLLMLLRGMVLVVVCVAVVVNAINIGIITAIAVTINYAAVVAVVQVLHIGGDAIQNTITVAVTIITYIIVIIIVVATGRRATAIAATGRAGDRRKAREQQVGRAVAVRGRVAKVETMRLVAGHGGSVGGGGGRHRAGGRGQRLHLPHLLLPDVVVIVLHKIRGRSVMK